MTDYKTLAERWADWQENDCMNTMSMVNPWATIKPSRYNSKAVHFPHTTMASLI